MTPGRRSESGGPEPFKFSYRVVAAGGLRCGLGVLMSSLPVPPLLAVALLVLVVVPLTVQVVQLEVAFVCVCQCTLLLLLVIRDY